MKTIIFIASLFALPAFSNESQLGNFDKIQCKKGVIDSCVKEYFRDLGKSALSEIIPSFEEPGIKFKYSRIEEISFLAYLMGDLKLSNQKDITILCFKYKYSPACLKVAFEKNIFFRKNKMNYEKGVKIIEENCNLKDSYSCYLYSIIQGADSVIGLKNLKNACSLGDLNSCLIIADDLAIHNKTKESLDIFSSLCDKRLDIACAKYGLTLYQFGKKSEAYEYLDRKCKMGATQSCDLRGSYEEEFGKHEVAKKYYELGCDQGSHSSCYILVNSYLFKEKNYSLSILKLKVGCKEYHALSCSLLGTVYAELGNDLDSEYYYQKACDGSSGIGCVGVLSNELKKKKTDKRKIKKYAELAKKFLNIECNNGNNDSCLKYKTLVNVLKNFI